MFCFNYIIYYNFYVFSVAPRNNEIFKRCGKYLGEGAHAYIYECLESKKVIKVSKGNFESHIEQEVANIINIKHQNVIDIEETDHVRTIIDIKLKFSILET